MIHKATKTKKYHHGDLRQSLLAAAAELVVTKGVEVFSLREAARRVGVTPTACYRHFSDKAALLNAVAIEGFSQLAIHMESELCNQTPPKTLGPKNALAQFASVGRAYVKFAVDRPAQFRVMFRPYGADGKQSLRGVASTSGRDPHEIFITALDALVENRVINRHSRVAGEISAWATIHGISTLLVEGLIKPANKLELYALIDTVIDNILRGLGYESEK